MSHADTLDARERLAKPFWGSLGLHVGMAALCLSYGWVASRSTTQFGDPHGGGMGSVEITPVPTIKLPSKDAPVNPVANDTESQAPEAPAKKKVVEKIKQPDADAIPIKSRHANKKTSERASAAPNKFREQQIDRPNQVYTAGGAQASSPMFNIPGGGGLQIGNDSPFGTQFGAYAKLIRDQVSRKWNSSEFDSRRSIPPAVVVFVIRRDGSIGAVKVTERSGNSALDISAQRAVMDAAPFPPLPAGFTKSEAQVELRFNLK
jgi:protein TonB